MQRVAAFAGMYKTGSSRPRRKMSAAARARIFAAQKARWAKAKDQKVVPIKAGKRRISPAGLARVKKAARGGGGERRGGEKEEEEDPEEKKKLLLGAFHGPKPLTIRSAIWRRARRGREVSAV